MRQVLADQKVNMKTRAKLMGDPASYMERKPGIQMTKMSENWRPVGWSC